MLRERDLFADKVVLITGATGSLGRALVLAFASSGAAVAIHTAHKLDEAQALAAEVQKFSDNENGEAEVFIADLTRPEMIPELFDRIYERMGQVDILVNNAGAFTESSQQNLPIGQWQFVDDLNNRATFLCTRELLLRRCPPGDPGTSGDPSISIVNIASINGLHPGFGGTAHYDASKGAVIAYTRSVAAEVGRFGIRVNAVAPGLIRTERLKQEVPELVDHYCRRAPLGRLVEPTAVADAVLFLASPYAASITGEILTVDCGYVLS